MTGPLLYLTRRSVWNRLRARVTRLRQPRYLAGLVVGGLYFYWFLFGQRRSSGTPVRGALDLIERYHDGLVAVGAVAFLLLMTLVWVWPGQRKLRLGFSRADVQFLFTAPIARADLIRYKVIRSQLGVVLGAAIMTLFFRPGTFISGWVFWLGMTVVLATVNVHVMGVSLALQPDEATAGRRSRARWPRLVLLGSCAVVLSAVASAIRADGQGGVDASVSFGHVSQVLSAGVPALVLWPWRALVNLPLSTGPGDFARHLPAALVLLVLNYVWVVRTRVPFEEAAAEMAERRTDALAGPAPKARRAAKGGRSPFRLAPVGRPEPALLWKNLLMLGRYVSVLLIVRIALLLVVVSVLASRSGRGEGAMTVIAGFAFVAAFIATLFGPQIVRNDLRQDLAYLETLKQWPIRGAEIVRGEVLTPTVLLTGVVWFAVALATALGRSWRVDGASLVVGGAWSWAVAAMLVAAGLVLAQVIAHNAVAVAFPAWARIGGARAQGIDVMGQRLLMLAAMVLVLAVAALPAAFAGGLVGGAAYALTGTVPVLAVGIPAAVTLFAEGLVATEALGSLLDRTDVTAIDLRE